MPNGKKAGERCVQLDEQEMCLIFGKPERPAFCASLQPNLEMCGDNRSYAITWLSTLEQLTLPT
jgi:hypothetical protein